jgi:hypothetical protein
MYNVCTQRSGWPSAVPGLRSCAAGVTGNGWAVELLLFRFVSAQQPQQYSCHAVQLHHGTRAVQERRRSLRPETTSPKEEPPQQSDGTTPPRTVEHIQELVGRHMI